MKQESKQMPGFFSIILRLAFYTACILLPAAGFYLGLDYFSRNHKSLVQNSLTSELNNIAAELALAADQETFWGKNLSDIFSTSSETGELSDNLKAFFQKASASADFIIYDDHGKPLADNLKDRQQAEAWQGAGIQLNRIMGLDGVKEVFAESKKLAEVFGPDFYLPLRKATGKLSAAVGKLSGSAASKSNAIKPEYVFWSAFSEKHLLLVRFAESELQNKTGLNLFFRENHKIRFDSAMFINDNLVDSDFSPVTARLALNRFKRNAALDLQVQDNRLMKIVQLDNFVWCILSLKLPPEKFKTGQLAVFLTMLVLFIIALFVKSGYLPARPEDMPLIAQILILMAITSGIPLGALGLISLSYFNSKKAAMINENFHQMRSYVKYLRNQIQVEHSRIGRIITRAITESKDILATDLNTLPNLRTLNRKLENKADTGYLVKKNQFASIKTGIERPKEKRSKKEENNSGFSQSRVERSNALMIASYFLSSVNEEERPDIPFEKAYMLEMMFQKPLPMFIQELMGFEGLVTYMGWGSGKLLLFNQAFKIAAGDLYDLYVFLTYTPSIIDMDFFLRHMHKIQQNPYGYRILIANSYTLLNENAPLLSFPEELRLFNHISSSQQTEPRFIQFDNESYLYYGDAGLFEYRHLRFCAIYPMEEINRKIIREASDFAYIGLLAVIVVCTMIVVLYLNLIMPVNKLHQAAEALENRDAAFRLSTDSKDEFGEMAEIFNQSISELDELNIASLVQARLLPGKSLSSGAFSIFGKSVPMADLGGDYFDYFAINENRFAMMLGDVAGHGVGAALIMAIAKAGVIVSESLASDPAAILTKLHQIILATKTKQQRKVMTFQYLVVDKDTNILTYANAGGCSPVLIDSNKGTITEIKHGGGVLGGFKKNNISNIELSIEPGQAVIFYTDGMVESRNPTGRELGYQGLYDIFLSSYNEDAEKFYQRINDSYRRWLSACEAGDDLTILIMTCQHSNKITEETV